MTLAVQCILAAFGVSELRIDYGLGYRVYLVYRGPEIVVLLCGGDKSTQDRDIVRAKELAKEDEMALETLPWDPAEHLKTAEDVREYLEAAFEDGDPALIAAALGDVARARGVTEIAREAGISREAMSKAFRPEGNPTLETLARVIRALGLKLTIRAA